MIRSSSPRVASRSAGKSSVAKDRGIVRPRPHVPPPYEVSPPLLTPRTTSSPIVATLLAPHVTSGLEIQWWVPMWDRGSTAGSTHPVHPSEALSMGPCPRPRRLLLLSLPHGTAVGSVRVSGIVWSRGGRFRRGVAIRAGLAQRVARPLVPVPPGGAATNRSPHDGSVRFPRSGVRGGTHRSPRP